MSNDPSWFSYIGIKPNILIAGFAGGVAAAFILKRPDVWAIAGSIVVGTLSAVYLAEPAAAKLGTPEGAAGFIVGLGGMAICQGITAVAARWRPSINGASNGPRT